jgi:signal transduction histidine kinase
LEQAQDSLGAGNPIAAEALEASRAETDRLQEMVEQLLALARIEGRAAAVGTVDAVEVVTSRADLWSSLANERGVDFQLDVPASARCVAIDGALEQIVDNYIDNALTVAPDNSNIVLRVSQVGNKTFVDVCDSGPGLSEQQLSLAFERFWRGKHTENAPGTGLGLAIVKQLAVASGGDAYLLKREDGLSGLIARAVFISA